MYVILSSSTVTSQWTKIELQGPPPACRLDFGLCVIRLRRNLVAMDTGTDVVTTTKQAQDVLEREMAKPGSATSRSSCPEFGFNGNIYVIMHMKKDFRCSDHQFALSK